MFGRGKCEKMVACWMYIAEATATCSSVFVAASDRLDELQECEDVLGRQQDHISLMAVSEVNWKRLQGTFFLTGANVCRVSYWWNFDGHLVRQFYIVCQW
jgi:hypothetical protein